VGLALSTALGTAAPLASAAEPQATTTNRAPGPLAASVDTAVAATTPQQPRALALDEQAAQTAGGGQSFLKTPKGRLALALVAAGFGYAIYNVFDDRVKSPGRN
jgi:hypothetical protein